MLAWLQTLMIQFPDNKYFYYPTQTFFVRLLSVSPSNLAFINSTSATATVVIVDDDGEWVTSNPHPVFNGTLVSHHFVLPWCMQ
jgi:hypothetical protein